MHSVLSYLLRPHRPTFAEVDMGRLGSAMVCAVAALFGCGGGDEVPGGGALSGTWTLPQRIWLFNNHLADYYDEVRVEGQADCPVKLSGSAGHASCTASIKATTGHDVLDQQSSIDLTLTIAETHITVDGTLTMSTTETYQDGDSPNTERYESTCSVHFGGTADRAAGRESAGRFAALAGSWTGTASVSGSCMHGNDKSAISGARRFTADVFGEQGDVHVTNMSKEPASDWEFQNMPTGLFISEVGSDFTTQAPEVN